MPLLRPLGRSPQRAARLALGHEGVADLVPNSARSRRLHQSCVRTLAGIFPTGRGSILRLWEEPPSPGSVPFLRDEFGLLHAHFQPGFRNLASSFKLLSNQVTQCTKLLRG